MKPWLRMILLGLGCVVTLLLLWAGWQWVRPIPRLNTQRFRTLMVAGRTAEAEKLLRDQLRLAPNDPGANFLLATLALDRADPSLPEEAARRQAEEALERLAKARPASPLDAAMVKVYEGKALYVLKRWGDVEQRMKEALDLEPTVPEAGWALLDLYYLQGRARDASELALKLHEVEPDPRDRVQLLLEVVRQDAQPPDAASIVDLFRPVLEADPDDVRAAVVLGNALVRNSQADEGLTVLRQAVERHPEQPLAWEGLLRGYDEAGQIAQLAEALERIPPELAGDPRFARFRGRLAQEQSDWPTAIDEYRNALNHDPHDPTLLYRLARVLRVSGAEADAEQLLVMHESYKQAMQEVDALYREANAVPDLGERSYPSLYRRLAELRARLLWPEQADTWRRLAGDVNAETPS